MSDRPSSANETNPESLETRRRRLLYRSWYCGIKEMDLLLGSFAKQHLESMTEAQLDSYEALLSMNNDPALYDWIMGRSEPPPGMNSDVLDMLRNFKFIDARS
ncbi:FAD assembly factor SdhE [Oceanibaculum indicum]|uniref:FAD assembly factor SdhE n=1 Tax=Oceanibaculum indicum TaxID=526216 RepID=A0A420WPZ3_9PROT|nr:succinate dehydrogenase assembly factor 2 [Oceanibaculum indicum]RKQ73121.1 antitoxin CptB [Oceanibaculum indicum]